MLFNAVISSSLDKKRKNICRYLKEYFNITYDETRSLKELYRIHHKLDHRKQQILLEDTFNRYHSNTEYSKLLLATEFVTQEIVKRSDNETEPK